MFVLQWQGSSTGHCHVHTVSRMVFKFVQLKLKMFVLAPWCLEILSEQEAGSGAAGAMKGDALRRQRLR